MRTFTISATLAVGLLFGTAQEAGAGFKLCQDVADSCRSSSPFNLGLCAGYLEALADIETKGVCLPEEITPKQLQDAFLSWMDNHQGDRLEPAPDCYRAAMLEYYPCR